MKSEKHTHTHACRTNNRQVSCFALKNWKLWTITCQRSIDTAHCVNITLSLCVCLYFALNLPTDSGFYYDDADDDDDTFDRRCINHVYLINYTLPTDKMLFERENNCCFFSN